MRFSRAGVQSYVFWRESRWIPLCPFAHVKYLKRTVWRHRGEKFRGPLRLDTLTPYGTKAAAEKESCEISNLEKNKSPRSPDAEFVHLNAEFVHLNPVRPRRQEDAGVDTSH